MSALATISKQQESLQQTPQAIPGALMNAGNEKKETNVKCIQPKLTVGAPDDPFEKEADSVADKVMRMPAPGFIQTKCAHCEQEEKEKVRKKPIMPVLQAKAEQGTTVSNALSNSIDAGKGGGSRMDNSTQSFMESRFGADFSQVKIHTDSNAIQMSRELNARAFTTGNDVYFNRGEYQPHSDGGKHLLAHELTHTLQQGGGSSVQRQLIQRNIHPPLRSDCTALDDYIRLIVVNQETPQSVTIFWNYSRATETAMVSSGKGKCCIDSSAGDDAVGANQAGSTTGQSNWTPIGVRAVENIYNLGAADERRYWTEFHHGRQIALHAYSRVDGTPLSHGCVRMGVDMARRIYCGSIVGRTQVEVRGFARPRCSTPSLQNEWTLDGISPIPRCTSRSGLGSEVERLQRVNTSSLNQTVINSFRIALGLSTTVAEATTAAQTAGADLWTASHGTTTTTGGTTPTTTINVDDRPLYWTRNFIVRELQQWTPTYTVTAPERTSIINTFELASRGQNSTTFRTVPAGTKRILITGFDPFGMDDTSGRAGAVSGINVGNTSGAVVLALDGQTITGTHCSAAIQGAIFPVRYADFDQGMVENYVRNFISGGNAVDMIITISRNRDDGIFELEGYAGRSRGAHTDNNAQTGTQSSFNTSMTNIHGTGSAVRSDEFTASTLPRSGMASGTTVISDDSFIAHRADGSIVSQGANPGSSTAINPTTTSGLTSDAGSGGDFLSNEIFYRVSLLQLNRQTSIPMGHLHVPAGTQAEYQSIVMTVRAIITRALNNSLCTT